MIIGETLGISIWSARRNINRIAIDSVLTDGKLPPIAFYPKFNYLFSTEKAYRLVSGSLKHVIGMRSTPVACLKPQAQRKECNQIIQTNYV
ncbi:MAG: hypothetical protein AAFY76_25770 [Cyanobacteria bacterium J06649_11]